MNSLLDYIPVSDVIRSTAPTFEQEPLSIDEAKSQCGLTGNDFHDPELKGYISQARQQFENDTGIVCYTGAHVWKQTNWPCSDVMVLPAFRPVTSITSIQYVDTSGATQTWSASNYVLDTSGVKTFVRTAYATDWPAIRGDINGITVTFVAGYSSVATIPQSVKTAVKLQVRILWLLQMENAAEAEKQAAAYDRLINWLMRRSYP